MHLRLCKDKYFQNFLAILQILLIFAPYIQSQNKRTSNRKTKRTSNCYSPMNPSHRPHCNGHDYYERFHNMNLLANRLARWRLSVCRLVSGWCAKKDVPESVFTFMRFLGNFAKICCTKLKRVFLHF